MTGRDRIINIINRRNTGAPGYWKGNPHEDALKIYLKHFGVGSEEELSLFLGDDLRWRHAESSYKHPEGKPIFDCYLGKEKKSHSQPGVFAECESISEVDAFPWPDLKYLDFSEYGEAINRTHDEGLAFFGGFWCPYFHIIADFFGMENYFIKMYEAPEIVEAVTEHVLDFYCGANELLFRELGDRIDMFFFGNDFGTQLDLFISPDKFRQFVLPGIKRLVGVAKRHDIKSILHSCGSITKALPMIINAGVEAIHPIQAKAAGMEAEKLAGEFGKDLVFMGGVDTQDLLPFGKPEEVAEEVYRLVDIFGPDFIISPSHEALLANVSPENLAAMSNAAKKGVENE
jgi:uroporphyrinogen decarboxylase